VQEIAEHALTILINLTGDSAILQNVASDDRFLGFLHNNLVVCVAGTALKPL
jgi:hypothetical protein